MGRFLNDLFGSRTDVGIEECMMNDWDIEEADVALGGKINVGARVHH